MLVDRCYSFEETVFVDRGPKVARYVHLILLIGSDVLVRHLNYLQVFIVLVNDRQLLLADSIVDNNCVAPLIVCADLHGLSESGRRLPATNNG